MSSDAPDLVARIAELLAQSSLNEPALHRLYARIPRLSEAPSSPQDSEATVVPDFAVRLNRLFAAVPGPGERPRTNSEVAAQLTAWGHPISKPYLSQLRAGTRTNPSDATVTALARFFRVPVGYFADEDHTSAAEQDYRLLTRLQFNSLRELSTRAFDLSEESQNLLTVMADRLRITEGLPEVGTGGTE